MSDHDPVPPQYRSVPRFALRRGPLTMMGTLAFGLCVAAVYGAWWLVKDAVLFVQVVVIGLGGLLGAFCVGAWAESSRRAPAARRPLGSRLRALDVEGKAGGGDG